MTHRSRRIAKISTVIICLAFMLAAGCAKRKAPSAPGEPGRARGKPYVVWGQTYHPYTDSHGFEQKGLASWYGPKFHGRRTSNGEKYDMEAMTAAHKLLPFNTYVEVTNRKNGKKTVVRINDRGPFVDGRVIDLSKAAARKLGVIGPGVAQVSLVAVGYSQATGTKPVKAKALKLGPFTVQVGAFAQESNAWRLAAILRTEYDPVNVLRYDRGDMVLYRVRVGKTNSLDQARKIQARLRAAGEKQAFTVAW